MPSCGYIIFCCVWCGGLSPTPGTCETSYVLLVGVPGVFSPGGGGGGGVLFSPHLLSLRADIILKGM